MDWSFGIVNQQSIAFLLDWMMKTAVILLLCLGLQIIFRKSRPEIRKRILLTGFICALAIPVLQPVAKSAGLNFSYDFPGNLVSYFTSPPDLLNNPGTKRNIESQGMNPLTTSFILPVNADNSTSGKEHSVVMSIWTILISIWIAGACAVLLYVCSGVFVCNRIIRNSQVASRKILSVADAVSNNLKLKETPEVMINRSFFTPFSTEFIKPKVVLPDTADDFDDATLRAILVHEFTHIKQRDHLWMHIVQAVCAMQWVNPFTWIAAKEITLEREKVCDNAVLDYGTKPSDYAEQLMAIAQRVTETKQPGWVMTFITRRNTFKERIMTILNSKKQRPKPSLFLTLSIIAIMFAVTLTVSAFQTNWVKANSTSPDLSASGDVINLIEDDIKLVLSKSEITAGEVVVAKVKCPESVNDLRIKFQTQTTKVSRFGEYFAFMIGTDRLMKAGVYPVKVAFTVNGTPFELTESLKVNERKIGKVELTFRPSDDHSNVEKFGIKDVMKDSSSEAMWHSEFIMPMEGRISFKFGEEVYINDEDPTFHNGVDIAAPAGQEIVSSNDGIIVFADYMPIWGKTIVIDHGKNVFTAYAHLGEMSVEKGKTVNKGDLIGKCGVSGRTTGPHLHWSLYVNGQASDPLSILR